MSCGLLPRWGCDIGVCPRLKISMMRMTPPQQGHGSRCVSEAIYRAAFLISARLAVTPS